LPFIEAVRQLQWEMAEEDCWLYIHPYSLPERPRIKKKNRRNTALNFSAEGVNPILLFVEPRTTFSEIRKKIAFVM
jgi:CTP synthase